jgi:hypothetical protein
VRQAEVDGGVRAGVSTKESAELRRLKREVAELRRVLLTDDDIASIHIGHHI